MVTDRSDDLFHIFKEQPLQSSSLIVCWKSSDLGRIASQVVNYMIESLGGEEVAELKPAGFFTFEGAIFRDDIIQVPDSRFWACPEAGILLFNSEEPTLNNYKFLNSILDYGERHCGVKELYTINAAPSLVSHNTPREILAVFNQVELVERFEEEELEPMTWEGPPATSSYLLWVAARRGLSGISLWPEIPFYLAAHEDPLAVKKTLSFLGRRLQLDLDLEELDEQAKCQQQQLSQLQEENEQAGALLQRLEDGDTLDEEEQMLLNREVYLKLEKES